jgi:hypothetical protein
VTESGADGKIVGGRAAFMDAELAHFKVEAGDCVACGRNLLQQKCIRDARGPICMTCASGPQTRAEPLIPGAILAAGIMGARRIF